MARYCWIVTTNSIEGCDAEFNKWYDERHVPDQLRVPGFVSAERFRLAPHQIQLSDTLSVIETGHAGIPYKYMTIYRIDTDDLPSVLGEITNRGGTEEMPMSPAVAPNPVTICYEKLHGDGLD